jgi:geranylgeranyl pyrophosphate synthase
VSATAPRDEPGPAPAQLAPVLEAGGAALRSLLDRTERRLAEVAGGHGETLGRHATATLAAGGKRLRPMLVFLAGGCADTSGAAALDGAGGEALVRAGAAVELLHMATLVHDDVLDRAALRRGKPTVFAQGGRLAATATGDLLFSRAFAELASTGSAEAVRALSIASSALARGELMQRADAWSDAVTPERYLERCRLKTASLFEASCRLGAIFGGRPELADPLGRFGERVGLAFQMLDDVLDVSGPEERTGKPRGADLLDGTVTLPLILAWRRDAELAELDLRETVTDAAQAEALCDRITLTGALSEAREQALTHVAEAKATLAALKLPEARRRALDLVADGVVERYA